MDAGDQKQHRNLELSAASLGAGPIRAMYHVTLPIIRPGVMIGALFAFIVSFDEVVIAIFIAGRTASTLPKKMWEAIRLEIDPTAAAASVFVIAVSVILLSTIHVLNRNLGS